MQPIEKVPCLNIGKTMDKKILPPIKEVCIYICVQHRQFVYMLTVQPAGQVYICVAFLTMKDFYSSRPKKMLKYFYKKKDFNSRLTAHRNVDTEIKLTIKIQISLFCIST